MRKLAWLWQISLFKTLANKHKTSIKKIAKHLKTDDGYALIVKGEKKTRVIRIFQLKDLQKPYTPRLSDGYTTQCVYMDAEPIGSD